ncbi:MAG: hypothetical protein ABSE00_06685 [Chitinispirillaceae bacterium]|jgi:hypothetical protein
MNFLMKAAAALALGCLISCMSGCLTSSSLVNKWHDQAFQAPPLGKMLVIAVRKDAAKRRIWEDAFAGQLVRHGVAATPSYVLFPDLPPDSNEVISIVQANGFDGIMVILRQPAETDTRYIPEHNTIVGHNDYSYFWPTYWTYYTVVQHPGYIDSQTVAIRTIDVATTGPNGHMIWSATSRTPDPGSVTDLQSGIAALVTNELARERIIRRGR